MKKKIMGTMILGLAVMLGSVSPVFADSRKVVTLGADLTEAQQSTMLRYFGVAENQVDIIYINNDDERAHLGSYVPMEQIGTKTFSCALVSPKTSGGIQVKTANLSWVTCNMIASTLSTSGVKNCQVVAASPFEVSGTGALTGVIMAYETASEVSLEPQKVELANEELVTTANLSDEIGQSKATAVINASKIEVVENSITDVTEITNIVNNNSVIYDVDITEEQSAEIAELLAKIAQQDYDITQLKATLERVQANVAGDAGADEETQKQLEESATLAEKAAKDAVEEEQGTLDGEVVVEDEEEDEEEISILDTTDLSALEEDGIAVIEGDTTSTVLEQETEQETEDDGTVSIDDEGDIPEAKADDEDATIDDEEDVEVLEETEEEVKEEDLDSEEAAVYTALKEEMDDVFDQNTVVDGDDNVVYLTEEAAKKLPELIEAYALKVLVKGYDEVAEAESKDSEIPKNIMEETQSKAEDAHFEDQNLVQIDKYIRRLVFKDSEDLLANCQLEDQDEVVLYNGIMNALKKVFKVEEETIEVTDDVSAEESVEEDSVVEDDSVEIGDEFADFVEEEGSF